MEPRLFFTSPALIKLLDTVLANNYDLLIAGQRIEASKALAKQARAPLFPTLNAAAIPSIRKFGLYTMDGAGNIVTDMEPGKTVPIDLPDYYLGLQTTWEVDLWGKLKNKKRAALSRFLATIEGRRLVQANLVAETAAAYYELLAADEELKLLDQTILIQEQAVEVARVQKQAAIVNELAVQQFEAQLLNTKSLRYEVTQLIIDAETRINMLAGRMPQHIPRDSSFFSSRSIPFVKTGVPSDLLRNRPDIRQAEMELESARADVKSARAAFFPSLMITGQVGFQAYKPSLLFMTPESIAYSLIGGLAMPLLNRNHIKGEFSRATAVQQEAIFNYQKLVNRGFLEVYQEMKKIQNLEKMFEYKQKESSVLSRSIEVSNDLFRTGRADYLEVLISRQNALRSNIELIVTRKYQYMSSVNLYKALGGGWN
jgi:NodT family efflux transporter outer membrane factor (OMF) lipoprotein